MVRGLGETWGLPCDLLRGVSTGAYRHVDFSQPQNDPFNLPVALSWAVWEQNKPTSSCPILQPIKKYEHNIRAAFEGITDGQVQ